MIRFATRVESDGVSLVCLACHSPTVPMKGKELPGWVRDSITAHQHLDMSVPEQRDGSPMAE